MATNKTVFLIGVLLIVLGGSMLAPYALQVTLNEGSHSFISASFITIFIGVLFILANLEKEFKLNLRQTFLFSFSLDNGRVFGSLPFCYHLKILVLVRLFGEYVWNYYDWSNYYL